MREARPATRCWRPIRIWKSTACRRSGTRSRCAGATASTRWAPRCPAARSWPSAARTDLSWGVTYMHADTSDFFIEDCRAGRLDRLAISPRRPLVRFSASAGSDSPQGRRAGRCCDVYENEQGILSRTPDPAEGPGKYLSVSWIGEQAGRRPGDRHVARCDRRAERGRRDGSRCASVPHPSLVWVFADREGHIGLQASGWLPQRGGGNSGIVPVAAWDAGKPLAGAGASRSAAARVRPADRLRRQRQRRAVPPRWTAAARPRAARLSQAANRRAADRTAASDGRRHAEPAVRRAQRAGPRSAAGAAWRWSTIARSRKSCRRGIAATRPTSTEATLFQHFYRHVVLQIFGNEQGIGWRRMFYLCTRMGYSTMVLTAIDRTLRKVTSSWWRGRSKKALVQRAAELRPAGAGSSRGRSSTRSTS